jgi:hypothetical protein
VIGDVAESDLAGIGPGARDRDVPRETVIGHMKGQGRLGRCDLKERRCDAGIVVLTAIGRNLRPVLP